jgi:hypothetical protein
MAILEARLIILTKGYRNSGSQANFRVPQISSRSYGVLHFTEYLVRSRDILDVGRITIISDRTVG